MLLRAALGLALLQTLVLAGVLWAWAERVAGAQWLAAFLLGVAVWIVGNELPNWIGAPGATLALHLLSTAPLTSVLFFHFCVVFCQVRLHRALLPLAYLAGAGAALAGQFTLPARWTQHQVVGWLAVAEPLAVALSAVWAVMAVAGVTVLLRSWWRARPPRQAQIAAVTASCGWGLLCLAGYGIALAGWPLYPFPLLALPLYPVILVYGVLRYGVFVANVWAGRALAWTLLLAVGLAVVAVMPLLLPFESRWLNGLAVALSCLTLAGPVRRLAHRLIYPGGEVTPQEQARWRQALEACDTPEALGAQAAALLRQRLGVTVRVEVKEPGQATISSDFRPRKIGEAGTPGLQIDPNESQAAVLHGWEAAPPGQRQVAEWMGSLLMDEARRLLRARQLARQMAEQERERQQHARLAELGQLAATVAHDLRNPLNIISMAVATAPAETRQDVQQQVQRMARLSSDLLDYAKPWSVHPTEYDLAAQLRTLAARTPGVRAGAGLASARLVRLDAGRIEQAVVNLLDNARTATQGQAAIELDLNLNEGQLCIAVCDDGPGVPEGWHDRVFEPFASRSPGGTGLGLAIVQRVAQAHGGRARLVDRPPWRTCFALEMPHKP